MICRLRHFANLYRRTGLFMWLIIYKANYANNIYAEELGRRRENDKDIVRKRSHFSLITISGWPTQNSLCSATGYIRRTIWSRVSGWAHHADFSPANLINHWVSTKFGVGNVFCAVCPGVQKVAYGANIQLYSTKYTCIYCIRVFKLSLFLQTYVLVAQTP